MAHNNVYSENIREMRDAAGFVTQIFGEKYSDISDYLVNLSGQESLYGTLGSQVYDDGTPVSITEYQIDPIKYYDMLDRSKKGAALERIKMINETFTNLGYQDFDIRNIASVIKQEQIDPITGDSSHRYIYGDINKKYLEDPYITTALARHIIASNPDTIPADLAGQATHWKTNWNTIAGAGKEEEFLEKHATYIEHTNVEDNVMDLMRDQDSDPFKIQPKE